MTDEENEREKESQDEIETVRKRKNEIGNNDPIYERTEIPKPGTVMFQ